MVGVSENYLGAYKSLPIRCKHPGSLVSLTDLHKANGSPSPLRPDKWLKLPEVQEQLLTIIDREKVEYQVDSKRNIVAIPGILEIFRGGDRFFQGTFASHQLALAYAKEFSKECLEWLYETIAALLGTEQNTAIKAKEAKISLGSILLDVYQLPSGEYRLSQTQASAIVEKDEFYFRYFLRSNSPEALPYKGFTPDKLVVTGNKKIRPNGIPIPLAIAFWTKEATTGNPVAARLLGACAVETIERRADKAFGITRTEDQYNRRFTKAFESFVTQSHEAKQLSKAPLKQQPHEVKVSTPFRAFYSEVSRKLKRKYEDGGIPGLLKEGLRDKIALLASYVTNSWKLTPCQELTYKLGSLTKTKYPDLVSGIFIFNNGGYKEQAVFIIQVFDLIVDYQDIEECVLKRRYIQIAKDTFGVDHAFMFFVAPFGATPDAANFIEVSLPDEVNGYVGVLTVKELYNFYYSQAIQIRQNPRVKSELNRKFKDLSEYRIPNNKFDFFAESVEAIQLSLLDDIQPA